MCRPVPNPPPTSFTIPSLWVVPVHPPWGSCLMHQTWTGYFSYGNVYVSMLFSQIIPPSPSPTESKNLFFTSLLLSCSKGPELSMETTWRGQLWQLRVYYEEVWACQRGKLPLLGDTWGEGWDHHKNFFPCECSQATEQHQWELQGLAWIATAILGSREGHWLPLLDPQAEVSSLLPCRPGRVQTALTTKNSASRPQDPPMLTRKGGNSFHN